MDLALIISVIFFALVFSGASRGWRKSRNKTWQESLVRLLVTLTSAIISVFVAKAVASAIANTLYEKLAAGVLPEQITALFEDLPSAPAVILALVCMIISPILFYPVRFIVKLILKLLSPIFVFLLNKLSGAVFRAASRKKERAAATEDASEAAEAGTAHTCCESANASEADELLINGEVLQENEAIAFESSEDMAAQTTNTEPESEHGVYTEYTEAAYEEPVKEKKRKKQRKSRKNREVIATSKWGRICGISFGVLAGALGVFIFFMPIMGFVGVVGTIEETIAGADISGLEEAEAVLQTVDSATHNAAVGTVNALGGRLMFNSLTTFKVKGEKITFSKETELICTVVNTAMTVTNGEKSAEEKSAALQDIMPALENSNIIPVVLSEFLAGASSSWKRGEDFCGISLPGEDGAASGLLLDTLSIFEGSTPTTIKEDAATIIKLADVVVRNDIIGNMPENPMDLLSNKTLVSDLFYEIFENARLKVLINSLINTGIEMMTEMMNIPADCDSLYSDFLSELCSEKNVGSEDELRDSFDQTFKKYGIDITKEALNAFTSSVIDTYGLSFALIGETEIKELLGSLTITVENGEKTVDISESEGFVTYTVLMTTDKIESAHGNPDVDSRTEANALAEVFASASEITTLFSGEGAVISDTVKSLGKILDRFAACQNIGKECVNSLIVALLQSDMVYDTMSLDKITATHFANSVISGTKNNKSYEDIMSEIANVIDTMADVSGSDEFDKNAIKSVISDLSPETATALKHIISGNLASQMGFGEESQNGVSDMLSSVFDNIAEAKNNGMDDATYEAETEKIANLLDTTMTITGDSDESIDVKTYVDSTMDSVIISDSLSDTVYQNGEEPIIDPLGTNMELGEDEKVSLVETLQGKIDSAKTEDKESTKKNAVAVAAYLNVRVEIVGNTVQIIEP